VTRPPLPPPLPGRANAYGSDVLRSARGRLLAEALSVALAIVFFVLTILYGPGGTVQARLWSAVFVPCGLFFQSAAVFEWGFFVDSPKGRFVYSLLGRTGARLSYWMFGLGVYLMAYSGAPKFLARGGVR
jgi:hypothetical protein